MKKVMLALLALLLGPAARADTIPSGGTLHVGDFFHFATIDPAQMYNGDTWLVARGVFRTLMVFAPGNPDPQPDLADGYPTVNPGATVWTFHLRKVNYGLAANGQSVPGVTGHPVKAQDIKYAIERLFLPSVGAAYPFYYTVIHGAAAFQAGTASGISGIQVPDPSTIVFVLDQPTGDFGARLALPATTPVPRAWAARFDAKPTSDYSSHVIATGPYHVKTYHGLPSGPSDPPPLIEVARNTYWDRATDPTRAAYVDGVVFDGSELNSDGDDLTQRIIGAAPGAPDFAFGGPSESFLEAHLGNPLILLEAAGATGFTFMRMRVPPFDDIHVRRAFAYVLPRADLVAALGGALLDPVATSILPPGMPGSLAPDAYDPFAALLERSIAIGLAESELRQSKYAVNGEWQGYAGPVRLITLPADRAVTIMQVVEAMLTDPSGPFRCTNVRLDGVPPPNITDEEFRALIGAYFGALSDPCYTGSCPGNFAAGVLGWGQDYPDAATFFLPLFTGSPDTTANSALYNDDDLVAAGVTPTLGQLIDQALVIPPGPDGRRAAAWEAANRMATERAALVPWNWAYSAIPFSPALVNVRYDSFFGDIDWVNVGLGTVAPAP